MAAATTTTANGTATTEAIAENSAENSAGGIEKLMAATTANGTAAVENSAGGIERNGIERKGIERTGIERKLMIVAEEEVAAVVVVDDVGGIGGKTETTYMVANKDNEEEEYSGDGGKVVVVVLGETIEKTATEEMDVEVESSKERKEFTNDVSGKTEIKMDGTNKKIDAEMEVEAFSDDVGGKVEIKMDGTCGKSAATENMEVEVESSKDMKGCKKVDVQSKGEKEAFTDDVSDRVETKMDGPCEKSAAAKMGVEVESSIRDREAFSDDVSGKVEIKMNGPCEKSAVAEKKEVKVVESSKEEREAFADDVSGKAEIKMDGTCEKTDDASGKVERKMDANSGNATANGLGDGLDSAKYLSATESGTNDVLINNDSVIPIEEGIRGNFAGAAELKDHDCLVVEVEAIIENDNNDDNDYGVDGGDKSNVTISEIIITPDSGVVKNTKTSSEIECRGVSGGKKAAENPINEIAISTESVKVHDDDDRGINGGKEAETKMASVVVTDTETLKVDSIEDKGGDNEGGKTTSNPISEIVKITETSEDDIRGNSGGKNAL